MHDHEVSLSQDGPRFVLQRWRDALDEIEQTVATRCDMSAMLNVVWRPESFCGRIVTIVEERVERFQDEGLVLFGCGLRHVDSFRALGDHFECINPRGVKRQILLDTGDCLVRVFVCPDGVFRFRSSDGNAVVRAITLVRTIGVMRGPNEQGHICIVSGQVVNRRISLLLEPKRLRRFSYDPACDRYTHLALSRRNRNGMVRPRNSDLLTFARLCLHCAPRGSRLQLRAAIDWNARACNPPRPIGRYKGDYVGD